MRKKKDLSFKNNQKLFETKMLKVKLKMILQKKTGSNEYFSGFYFNHVKSY